MAVWALSRLAPQRFRALRAVHAAIPIPPCEASGWEWRREPAVLLRPRLSAQTLARAACCQGVADRRNGPRRGQNRPSCRARLRDGPVLRRSRKRRASQGAARHHASAAFDPARTGSRSGARALSRRDRELSSLEWIGYLSTVGVYGHQEGRWVDETTPPKPNSARTEARVEAEQAWLAFGQATGVPCRSSGWPAFMAPAAACSTS